MMKNLLFLDTDHLQFPHPATVSAEGILALFGDLSVDRLLLAYHYGIYPWYNPNEPIIWWCPNPRYVIFPSKVKVAKSMHSYFNQNKYRVTYNTCFDEVIRQCQNIKRKGQTSTWIDDRIIAAYTRMHHLGYAWSVEVWDGDELAGVLYGMSICKVFYGESMFSLKSNASKFGFITLARRLEKEGYKVIDCQQPNAHLESLGGEFIQGEQFHEILRKNRLEWLSNP